MQMGPKAIQAVRDMFTTVLGEDCHEVGPHRFQEYLDRVAASTSADTAELQATIAARNATIAAHVATIATRDATIVTRNETIAARDATIVDLNAQIYALQNP